ncbi:MAG: protein kinase [Chloroflexi bacterium]|nr:protein kinase [Chloroflexota bacterium]MCC6893506.1 protein kinase [Anaerolineae bacterium]
MANNETILNHRYRLLAQQGSGGMAVIYKAQDLELSRMVAVKILRPSLTADPSFLTRFRNEARSVANLQHPNIVTIYDVGREGDTQYIVMEFVDGQDLKKIIKTEGILTVDRALKLAIQICAGIGFAHRAQLVHADVKPQNILVTRGDVVKVTDFGIAQAFSDTQPPEKQQVVWGSPHYFAPEQAKGEKPTPASDVYAIGIVMFEMLTGRLPYVGGDQQQLAMAHIRDRIPMVTEFNPSVPEALAQIVYKVMSKEPGNRYRTADQLGHVLESYRDRGRDVTSPNAPAYRPPAQPAQPQQQYSQQAAPQQQYPQQQQYPPQQPQQPDPLPFSSGQPPVSSPLPFTQGQPSVNQSPFQQPQPLPFTQGQPPTGEPTQRYSLAPEAPQMPPYNRQQPQQQSAPTYDRAGNPQYPAPTPAQWGNPSNSQPLYNFDRENEPPQALDAVTIALAVLAFFAVLCLIPLWIQVYLARFAGG